MMDPREISAMAGQIMAPPADPMAQQPMQAPAPDPAALMAMLGGGGGAPSEGPPAGMPPGMPMDPGMMPPPGAEQGGPPTKPAPDLVPPGLKEEIAKYAAEQQVKMSKQLLALAGPESSDVPAGRSLLKELWSKRKDGVSDEQIQQWKAEGKKPAWILANSYPGRYALMAMNHWRPGDKLVFARKMAQLMKSEAAPTPGGDLDYVAPRLASEYERDMPLTDTELDANL